MPNRIIAICGQAAVGKQHFINELKTREDLRARFGITGSFQVFGPKASDVDNIRFADCEVAVWKWQHFTHYFIYGFSIDFSDVDQQVLLLWRPASVHLHDHREKGRQRLQRAIDDQDERRQAIFKMTVDMDEEALRRQWQEHFLTRFGESSSLVKKLSIQPVLLDASTSEYRPIGWDVTSGN